MKTLFIDCSMGAAGDMLTAALLELCEDKNEAVRQLNDLGVPGVKYIAEDAEKHGIHGLHVRVEINGEAEEDENHMNEHHHDHDHDHHHHHTTMHDIEHIVIDHLNVSDKVKKDVLAVYQLIAQAESHAHQMPVEEIHFHEVGAMDAVADVTAVCFLVEKLGVEKIIASPVHTGYGEVECAHGKLLVPAPATAYILQGVPMCAGNIEGELCTPTGAALLKHFVDVFEQLPVIRAEKFGYGIGTKEFPSANVLRVILGETEHDTEEIEEYYCAIDDMSGEEFGFAQERLFEAGALDVYTIPITMKKSRPGILLNVTCRAKDREQILKVLFRDTTTLGVKCARYERYAMDREIEELKTSFGNVHRKCASGYGTERSKLEYEDVAEIARKQNLSLREVRRRIEEEK